MLRRAAAPRRATPRAAPLKPAMPRAVKQASLSLGTKFVCVMPSRLSSAATGGLRTLSALLIVCSIFVSTEAGSFTQGTVKLLLGESENRLQGNSGSTPFTKSYSAAPHSGVVTSARSSNINATLTPSTQSISFSDILIEAIDVDVTAAHIHGPCCNPSLHPIQYCPNESPFNPCSNGAIVYTICSPTGPAPCPLRSSDTVTIPGFTVDIGQLNGNVSTAFGLYQNMMYSNMLYYLNFHTLR
jgi:hypothetical protein